MFEVVRKTQKAKLIPFLMAGYPNLEMSEKLALCLIEEGASAIELGVPFSDAFADGPVIQRAGELALQNDVSLDQVLELATRIHRVHPQVPIIIFSYFNPILQYGIKNYVSKAKELGVAASLTVDLPPEEAQEYFQLHQEADLKTIFLASPTSSRERLLLIDRYSTGFIYVVSRSGVTGIQKYLSETLADEIARIREVSRLPLAVGFGISNAEQARVVGQFADAVVVGSAFVQLIEQNANNPLRIEKAFRELARELVCGIEGVS